MARSRISLLLITLLGLSGLSSGTSPIQPVDHRVSLSSGEIIVKLKSTHSPTDPSHEAYSNDAFSQLCDRLGCRSIEPLVAYPAPALARHQFDRIRVLKMDSGTDLDRAVSELYASGMIDYAEPNYKVVPGSESTPSVEPPNDPAFSGQWGLRNLGLAVSGFPATLDADIRALTAWSISRGSPAVVVAVTDTGVDIKHPDLAANIFTSAREIPENGRDDDGNGFVDDVNGYNVADQNADVSDILGHGTQMAGIIAGVTNNQIGISGLSQSKIMPVRFFRRVGTKPEDIEGTVTDAARAILYAVAAGANIINASWSTVPGMTQEPSRTLADAVEAANAAGVLMVCISGNQGQNIDFDRVYPAAYQLSNQIVVAASDQNDELWHLYEAPNRLQTNYGARMVHIAAPGSLVLTTAARGRCALCSDSVIPEDWYKYIDGSSAAAAFVSGVAALIVSEHPDSNMILTKRRMIESADVRQMLRGLVANSGRLNAEAALTIQLAASTPLLKRLKYKPGSGKMSIFGDGMAPGVVLVVAGSGYPTKVKGDSLIAFVPQEKVPIGRAIEVKLLNPDGGESATITFTR